MSDFAGHIVSVLPNLQKHSALLLPLRIAITEKYSSETRLLSVLVQLCQEGKKHLPLCRKHFPAPFPLSESLLLIELCRFPGMKKPLAVAVDCEMGYHSKAFLANAERRLLGNSWDSKHHNWSGYPVAETGIQMREVHMQNQSPNPPQFALILQPEAVSLWLPATPDSLYPPVVPVAGCCINQQPSQPLIMIQQQCHLIKNNPITSPGIIK